MRSFNHPLALLATIALALAPFVFSFAFDALADAPITGGQGGTVTCGTTATPIVKSGSTFNFTSLRCDNYASATAVYVGFSDVSNASPHVCIASSGCTSSSWAPEVVRGQPYCRVAAGTVAIGCQWGY